jgi:hypothetical protein
VYKVTAVPFHTEFGRRKATFSLEPLAWQLQMPWNPEDINSFKEKGFRVFE